MAQQCRGITKNGEQCKMTGTFSNGYCFRHQNQAQQTVPEAAGEPEPTVSPAVNSESPLPPPPRPETEPEPQAGSAPVKNTPDGLVPALFGVLFILLALLFFNRRRTIRFIGM